MEEKNEYLRLPMAYKEACNDPKVIVLSCHHLKNSLCPKTCGLAKQEPGRLESAVQTGPVLN